MMGLSDGRKSFLIGLAVLIQYRSMTDTQPPSHVAVAITLNAQASSLIKLSTSLDVSIYYFVMLSQTKLWQNSVISHNCQQKLKFCDKNDYFPELICGDSVCFAKLTLQIQYTQYSQLCTECPTSDHAIMHVQFSNGVTVWQRELKRLVNTFSVHSNVVNKRSA